MNTLRFPLTEVLDHAHHAQMAASWKPSFLDRMEDRPGTPSLWWVKDSGCYLMSNGVGDGRPPVVWARTASGLVLDGDDRANADLIYQVCADVCGGDDFTEEFGLDEGLSVEVLSGAIAEGFLFLELLVSTETVDVSFAR